MSAYDPVIKAEPAASNGLGCYKVSTPTLVLYLKPHSLVQPLPRASMLPNIGTPQATTAGLPRTAVGTKRGREDADNDGEGSCGEGLSMPKSLKRRKQDNEVLKGHIAKLQEDFIEAKKALEAEKEKTEALRVRQ